MSDHIIDKGRVLLVGIDGARFDAVSQAATPALDALHNDGCFRKILIPAEGITVSGPMWTSILTGRWPSDHQVMNNDSPPPRRIPDVFSSLRRAGLLQKPTAAAAWPPILSNSGCGPIVDPTNVDCFAAPMVDESPDSYFTGDKLVLQAAKKYLNDDEVDACFVYFGEVDEVGHTFGVGPEYIAAIERSDEYLGGLLTALDQRKDRSTWTVIVTTDHGHVDSGGHGGESTAEREIWVASDKPLDVKSPIDIYRAVSEAITAS